MSGRLRTHGRALLLLPWIGLILGLLFSGGYTDFVADWHAPLQVVALALLVLAFIGEMIRSTLDREMDLGHGPGCDCGHHDHGSRPTLTLVLAHLAPMILYLAVGPPLLGLRPELKTPPKLIAGPGLDQKEEAKPEFTADGYLITDLARLHRGWVENQKLPPLVVVQGQFYRLSEADLERDVSGLAAVGVRSFLFRYTMTCCAADARPVAVGLLAEREPEADQQAWLEIKGEPMIIQGKQRSIGLEIHSAKQIPKPADPYLMTLN